MALKYLEAGLHIKGCMMIRFSNGKKILISSSVLVLISLVVFFYIKKESNTISNPVAVRGEIDLRTWDFNNRIAKLDGEWEFYWNRFITVEEFNNKKNPKPSNMIQVPATWNSQPSGNGTYDIFGFATYRLTAIIDPAYEIMAFRVPEINTAYKMWVNGELLVEKGVTGKDKTSSVPQYLPLVRMFKPEDSRIEIIIHVSNFIYTHGGIWKSILLGNEPQILKLNKSKWVVEGFLIGALLAIGIYHIGIFLLYRKEYAMLYFGLFCLIIMVRTFLTGERLFFGFFPEFNWEAALKIDHLSVFFGPMAFLLFLRALYPDEINRYIYRVFIYAELIGSFFCLILSLTLFEPVFIFFQMILGVISTYCFFVLISALRKKRYGAKFLTTGYLVLFLTVINDILYSRFVIDTGFIIPFGLAFYILFAFGLQKKFVQVEKQLKLQRHQLKQAEKMTTLGTFVLCVTHDINNPNTSIKITSQELAALWKNLLPLLKEYRDEFGDFDIGGRTYMDLKENIHEDFDRITRNSERIHHIVNGLKNFATPDRKNTHKKISINSAIKTSIQLFHNNTGKNISFSADLEKNIPDIKGKFWDLVQVIINLMQNACDAVNKKENIVFIKTYSNKPYNTVCVSIKDEGIGISKDKISKIQNKFYTTKRDADSIGLGLFIASVIIKNHNGELEITSEEGKGTLVKLIFNMADKNDHETP